MSAGILFSKELDYFFEEEIAVGISLGILFTGFILAYIGGIAFFNYITYCEICREEINIDKEPYVKDDFDRKNTYHCECYYEIELGNNNGENIKEEKEKK
jgi:hypothetical protein